MKKALLFLLIIISICTQAQTTTTIVGSGTINKVPKFTRVNRIGNSNIFDNGKVGINTNTPTTMLQVNGTGKFTDTLTITTMNQNDNSKRAATTEFVQNLLSQIPLTNYDSSWSTEGNTGTTPFKNFVGTKDNQDFVFRTDNNERMRITATGDIGIGTTQPFTKLDVEGSLRINDGTQAAGRVFTSNSNGTGSWQVPTGVNLQPNYNWTGYHSIITNTDESVLTVQNTRPYGQNGIYSQLAQKWLDKDGNMNAWLNANTGRMYLSNMLQVQQITPNAQSFINAGRNGGLRMQGVQIDFINDYDFFGNTLKGAWFLQNNGGFVIDAENGNNVNDILSSKFSVNSTVKGSLPAPRMTKFQRDAIPTPAQGLEVFVTDNGGYLSWYNSGWQKVSSVAD